MYFVIWVLLLVFTSCNPKGGENKTKHQLLSKNIEYDVVINNYKMEQQMGWLLTDSYWDWYRSNLEGSVRSGYMDLLWKNALAGKLELCDMNDKKIDTTELKKILTVTDSVQIFMGNKLIDTVLKKIIDPAEITILRFREEWTFDHSTMAITKKVLAMAPIQTSVIYDKSGKVSYGEDKALFWIKFSKEPTNTKVLTKRIMTNTAYYNTNSVTYTKNADTSEIRKYTDVLLNRAYKDSIDVYDPISFMAEKQEQESGKELYRVLTKIDTVKSNGNNTVISRKPYFNAIRFLEEWNFDPNTMAIQKTVVGLCPVVMLYESDGVTFKGYQPCFWVYFKDIWAPFDGKMELKKIEKKKEK